MIAHDALLFLAVGVDVWDCVGAPTGKGKGERVQDVKIRVFSLGCARPTVEKIGGPHPFSAQNKPS